MKPHPRIRKAIKWGGAAVKAALLIGWLTKANVVPGSGGYVVVTCPACEIGAGGKWSSWKLLLFDHNECSDWTCYRIYPGRELPSVWFPYSFRGRAVRLVIVPGWVLPSLMAVPTVLAWRLDRLARRRARLGLCPKCHYDRTGLAPAAPCPECGSLPAEPAAHA